MRLRRLRHNSWAAWFGVVALVLNALVPVHLAFDLADVLGAAPHHGAGSQWRLLARLTGHRASGHDRDHGSHRPPDCPVCSALGSLGGLAPAAAPQLSLPVPVAAAPAILPPEERRAVAAVAAYRSRAPPVA
jgi:hypothetical protein